MNGSPECAVIRWSGVGRLPAGGGQGGIRTHGGREPTAVFKTAALNHSATCPSRCRLSAGMRCAQALARCGERVFSRQWPVAQRGMGSNLRIFVAAILLAGLPVSVHAQEVPDTSEAPEP